MASSGRESQREEGNDKNHEIPRKEGPKRRRGSLKQADICATRNMRGRRAVHDQLGSHLEPLFRRVVREEVPPILRRHFAQNSCEETLHQTGASGSRTLRLCFTNRLPAKIFTHTGITSAGGDPIEIVLRDAASQNSIVREGPLSCSRIMMCVLKGDFDSNGSEDWSAAEFNANLSPRRENKGELLKGEKFVTLENGVGVVPDDIAFTDNSSWTRSRTFRLGTKAVENQANIREGRSEAFVVMDKRGQPYEKHDRPSLNDQIWRLKKIARDGQIHQRLSLYGVNTVKDLLRLQVINPRSLKEKMGKVAKKLWDTIIEHARSCEVDNEERYTYQHLTAAQQPIGLLFNSIYELLGVSFDGNNNNYRSLESLNSEQMCLVEIAKRNAYYNMEVSIYGPMADSGQPSTSRSLIELIQDEQVGSGDQIQMELHGTTTTCGGGFVPGRDWELGAASGLEFANCLSPDPWPQWGMGNTFGSSSSSRVDGTELIRHYLPELAATSSSSRSGKGKTVWNKIRHTLRWVMLFVAKRKAKLSIPCN